MALTYTTDEVIASMLVENTGTHILDSGSAYGRSWQRNQAAAGNDALVYFKAQPEAHWDYGSVTLNVFHFLSARLDYAPALDRALSTWIHIGPDDRYTNSFRTIEEFVSALDDKGYVDSGSDFNGMTVNTYNNEDALSQVIQYTIVSLTDECPFADNGEDYYVFLSIHGGCDVRGGYTDYRAFALNGYDGVCYLLANADASCGCDNDDCPYAIEHSSDNWPSRFGADTNDAGYSWHDWKGSQSVELYKPEDAEYNDPPQCPHCHIVLNVYPPIVG
jgi:hypothetical protein